MWVSTCVYVHIMCPTPYIWYTKVIAYHTYLSFLGNASSDPVRDTTTTDLLVKKDDVLLLAQFIRNCYSPNLMYFS